MGKHDAGQYTIVVGSGSKTDGATPEAGRIEKALKERVFGQDRAIRRLVGSIAIREAGLNDPRRPLACLVFAGPSGVGKTLTAKEFAHAWLGEPEGNLDSAVIIACGSLTLEHQITSLTGSPPSYVGYNDEPALASVGAYDAYKRTKPFREGIDAWFEGKGRMQMHPVAASLLQQKIQELAVRFAEPLKPFRSVVIFDEFEKAHPTVQKELLHILEEGKLRLQSGMAVDFTGSVIILTTNIGTSQITEQYLDGNKLGFRTPVHDKDRGNIDTAIWRRVVSEIEKYLQPELLSRIGGQKGIIVFHVLKREDYLKILDKELAEFQDVCAGIELSFAPEFKDFLLEKSENSKYGARILRDAVAKYVREPLAQQIAAGQVRMADKLFFTIEIETSQEANGITHKKGTVVIKRQPRARGKTFPIFTPKNHRESPLIDVGKAMDDFFDELHPPHLQPPPSAEEKIHYPEADA